MAESHVISGLVFKRSELAGLVEHHRKQIARIGDDLKALDAAIKIFDPDYDLRTVRAKSHLTKNSFFEHGEASKLILDVLRETEGKLNTLDIGNCIAARKGFGSGNNRRQGIPRVHHDSDKPPACEGDYSGTGARRKRRNRVGAS